MRRGLDCKGVVVVEQNNLPESPMYTTWGGDQQQLQKATGRLSDLSMPEIRQELYTIDEIHDPPPKGQLQL